MVRVLLLVVLFLGCRYPGQNEARPNGVCRESQHHQAFHHHGTLVKDQVDHYAVNQPCTHAPINIT